jgi:hypothetical protein
VDAGAGNAEGADDGAAADAIIVGAIAALATGMGRLVAACASFAGDSRRSRNPT